jgi:hypothetical protein
LSAIGERHRPGIHGRGSLDTVGHLARQAGLPGCSLGRVGAADAPFISRCSRRGRPRC